MKPSHRSTTWSLKADCMPHQVPPSTSLWTSTTSSSLVVWRLAGRTSPLTGQPGSYSGDSTLHLKSLTVMDLSWAPSSLVNWPSSVSSFSLVQSLEYKIMKSNFVFVAYQSLLWQYQIYMHTYSYTLCLFLPENHEGYVTLLGWIKSHQSKTESFIHCLCDTALCWKWAGKKAGERARWTWLSGRALHYDWKVMEESSRKLFFSRATFLRWLLFQYLPPSPPEC